MKDALQLTDLRQSASGGGIEDMGSTKSEIVPDVQVVEASRAQDQAPYKLYRWRWVGLFGMVRSETFS
jgi:hypothetical protein